MLDAMSNARTAVAVQMPELPDADGFPTLSSWEVSGPLRFSADWQGNDAAKIWVAELALPMKCFVARFDPAATWRVNFYRVEGAAEPRFYSAWQPTQTPAPNFHVPEAFGELVFVHSPLPRE